MGAAVRRERSGTERVSVVGVMGVTAGCWLRVDGSWLVVVVLLLTAGLAAAQLVPWCLTSNSSSMRGLRVEGEACGMMLLLRSSV